MKRFVKKSHEMKALVEIIKLLPDYPRQAACTCPVWAGHIYFTVRY